MTVHFIANAPKDWIIPTIIENKLEFIYIEFDHSRASQNHAQKTNINISIRPPSLHSVEKFHIYKSNNQLTESET